MEKLERLLTAMIKDKRVHVDRLGVTELEFSVRVLVGTGGGT